MLASRPVFADRPRLARCDTCYPIQHCIVTLRIGCGHAVHALPIPPHEDRRAYPIGIFATNGPHFVAGDPGHRVQVATE